MPLRVFGEKIRELVKDHAKAAGPDFANRWWRDVSIKDGRRDRRGRGGRSLLPLALSCRSVTCERNGQHQKKNRTRGNYYSRHAFHRRTPQAAILPWNASRSNEKNGGRNNRVENFTCPIGGDGRRKLQRELFTWQRPDVPPDRSRNAAESGPLKIVILSQVNNSHFKISGEPSVLPAPGIGEKLLQPGQKERSAK